MMLNIFEVDKNRVEVPQDVYLYKVHLKTLEQRKRDMCIAVLRNSFGYLDVNSFVIYSYKEIRDLPRRIKKYCDLEPTGKVKMNEVDENVRNALVKTFLRSKIRKDIKKLLKKFKKFQQSVGRWTVALDLERIELVEHNGEILVSFNVKLNISSMINLWDIIERDVNRLKGLCWSPENLNDNRIWFRYIPHLIIEEVEDFEESAKSFILSDVHTGEEFGGWTTEDLKKYPENEYGLSEDAIKKIGNYTQFDSTQPIIKGVTWSGKEYPFLPQHCIPAYNPMLATAEEKKRIEEIKINLKNKKDEIIRKIIEQLPYLKQPDNIEIKKVQETARLRAKFVKVEVTKGKITKTLSQPYEKPVSSTLDLFGWISRIIDGGDGIIEICIPDYIPENLSRIKEIEAFLLIENDLNENERKVGDKLLNDAIYVYNFVRSVCLRCGINIPYLNYKGNRFYFENSKEGIRDIYKRITTSLSGEIGFALIFGKRDNYEDEEGEDSFDYYNPLKSALFRNNILSQNFDVTNYVRGDGKINKNTIKYAVSNIIYNIFGKLGVKFFVLEEDVPYDYILGIDVGYGEAYTGKVAGCTTVHDSEGRLRNLIPIEKQNYPSKETARIKALLEEIEQKKKIYNIDFENKSILILRDGRINKEEINQLMEFSEERNCRITYIEIRKNIVHQFLVNSSQACYVKIGDYYILKAHNPRIGFPRAIKIARKIVIEGDAWRESSLTEDDILLIYKLTALNYSTIGRDSNLRIPAPIYYADKLVKALKKGWKFDERFLRYGILYFL
ncbi:stem cell self-renewal protein Piwi domain protein [Ferroglobus placidus DSM 10642]|uniref:Stem cell self-renewal protein Piwi domain protein n=1 Tax=Ferroglobus placidus (strain DSM 10642 / AEDII12DO) TaxID=589924 RepID=D3S0S6_FERPA|nr:Piwi domain-containing protein [Ferroglobus placidus]ADC66317.1 stem cell self-renewal protein Piwi domain protein [Ferroglobus placidus DSM 10642]